jgi:predicted metal-dependent hydrolase
MKKSDRIEEFIGTLGVTPAEGLHECYLGYFACFNRGEYYEAHDVLEHLWLQGAGENYAFFKGLIQLAGAFVHLQKQYLHPTHPKHGRRLRPAVRLFRLALTNLEPYGPRHLRLDVAALCGLAREWMGQVEAGGYERNPWSPDAAPRIELQA